MVRRAARRAIEGRNRSQGDPTCGRFTSREVVGIVDVAFSRFERHVPDLPTEPTVGSRQNLILAALTLALLEALEDAGIERRYAIELTGDAGWRVYRRWGQVTGAATRFMTRDPIRRLRLNVNAFLTFPFGRPGYRFDDVAQDDGRSLDMRRCPVADYLGSRGAADLCAGSWCNLDYALAEMWGGTLQRSGTLLGGASCCDFRFRVSTGPVGSPGERALVVAVVVVRDERADGGADGGLALGQGHCGGAGVSDGLCNKILLS